jgi:hypothetical protein
MTEASEPRSEAKRDNSIPRGLFVACTLAGWLVSYAFFIVWLRANDWAFFQGWRSAFTGSLFGTGLLSDLVFTTFAVALLAWDDRRRLGTRWVALILGAGALSVSMMLLVYAWRTWQVRRASS